MKSRIQHGQEEFWCYIPLVKLVRTESTSINAYLQIVISFSTALPFGLCLASYLLGSKLSKDDISCLLSDHVG
jgi:hypothetical protein